MMLNKIKNKLVLKKEYVVEMLTEMVQIRYFIFSHKIFISICFRLTSLTCYLFIHIINEITQVI